MALRADDDTPEVVREFPTAAYSSSFSASEDESEADYTMRQELAQAVSAQAVVYLRLPSIHLLANIFVGLSC